MNARVKLESGVMLEMTMLSFEEGLELFQAVSKELINLKLDLGDIDLSSLSESDAGDAKEFINTIKNAVLSMIVSNDIKSCIKNAFKRCLYNNIKIDESTFEDVESRGDYFIVCWEVLKFNITPFLPKKNLQSITSLFGKTKSQG